MARKKGIIILAVLIVVSGVLGGLILEMEDSSAEDLMGEQEACQHHLQQWHAVFVAYAADHAGDYPPLAPYPDFWAPDLRVLCPEYLTDLSILRCPSGVQKSPWHTSNQLPRNDAEWRSLHEAMSDYVYLGHDMSNVEAMVRVAEVRPAIPEVPRLNTAAAHAAAIPVMFDELSVRDAGASFNHSPGVANVLYLDGSTRALKFPGDFPINREVSEFLGRTVKRISEPR